MDSLLRRLNDDVATKEALLNYLTGYFKTKIVEQALKGQNPSTVAAAINELKLGFDQLSIDYGIKFKQQVPEENPAK